MSFFSLFSDVGMSANLPAKTKQNKTKQASSDYNFYLHHQIIWTIGRSGERGSGISVLPARYDDDDVFVQELW